MKNLTWAVEVDWVDPHAVSEGTWTTLDEIDHKPRACRTVGYIAKESKEALTIVCSQSLSIKGEISQVGDGVVLPKSVILKVTPLERVKE